MTWTVTAMLLLLAAARAPTAEAQALRVHAPAPDSIVSGGGVSHLLVEVEGGRSAATVRARLHGLDLGPGTLRARSSGGGVLHWTLQLVPGPNPIEVEAMPPGASPVREQRSVYFFTPIFGATDPRGFRRVAFHQRETAAVCAECHVTRPVVQDQGPPTPQQSTCYSCHAGLTTRVKEVHGPAALWACTRCHDPKAAPHPYATPEPVMPLCYGCHQEQKNYFYGNPYQHGPTATGFCTICHNPHGTDNVFFIKKAAFNLCTTCHYEKTGRHVISWGPTGQGHPLRGRPDPKRPHRELSCASCHNPHAAKAPRLWNFNATVWIDLCRNCHGDKLGG